MELKKYGKYYVLSAGLSKKIGRNAAELLFYLSAWQGNNGYVFRTQKQIEEDIGLSPYQQRGARKKLINLNLLREIRQSIPCRLFYTINLEELEKYQVQKVQEEVKKAVGDENMNFRKDNIDTKILKNFTTSCKETSQLENDDKANIDKPKEPKIVSDNNNSNNNNSKLTEEKSIVIKSVNLDSKKNQKINHIFQIYLIFSKYYQLRYNVKPVFNNKVAGQIKYLWESIRDSNKIEKIIETFMNAEDSYICAKFHDIGLLINDIQKWNVLSQYPEQSKVLTEEYIRKRKYIENTQKAEKDIEFERILKEAYERYGNKYTKEEIYNKLKKDFYGND